MNDNQQYHDYLKKKNDLRTSQSTFTQPTYWRRKQMNGYFVSRALIIDVVSLENLNYYY